MGIRKDTRVRELSPECKGVFKTSANGQLTMEGMYHYCMMTRATSPNYKIKYPTYINVTVSDNMRDYQYFVPWCRRQVGFGNLGWVLDKDLVLKGNTTYHEDICVFVPPILNGFILNKYTSRRDLSLPLGVSWSETEGKFRAFCSQLNGKNRTIGRYNNPTDAGLAYIEFKNNLARDLANTWRGKVDERVIDFLLNYDVVEQSSEGCSTHHLYN